MAMQKDSRELRARIRAAQNGDERAFEQLLTHLETAVYRLAFSVLRHKEDAEDATQETLIKLWRTLPQYRFECPILPYVLKMARTTALDIGRRVGRIRENEHSLAVENEAGERVMIDIADTDEQNDPVAGYARDERIRVVRRAIEQLPDEYREILVLKDMQGYSYDQIGVILQLEGGTVKSRLARARKKLMEILQKNGNIF